MGATNDAGLHQGFDDSDGNGINSTHYEHGTTDCSMMRTTMTVIIAIERMNITNGVFAGQILALRAMTWNGYTLDFTQASYYDIACIDKTFDTNSQGRV